MLSDVDVKSQQHFIKMSVLHVFKIQFKKTTFYKVYLRGSFSSE